MDLVDLSAAGPRIGYEALSTGTLVLGDPTDAVERRFEKAIQASLDVGSRVVAAEGYREPQNYGDIFEILGEEGVLSPETAELMVEMAGFRNVLAHEYAAIDDERVYHHLQDLERFRTFARELHAFVEEA